MIWRGFDSICLAGTSYSEILYIVMDRLNQLMKEAFNEVTKKARIKVKFNQNLTKTQLYAHGAQDRGWFLDMFQSLFKGNPTNGYKRRLERHRKHFS